MTSRWSSSVTAAGSTRSTGRETLAFLESIGATNVIVDAPRTDAKNLVPTVVATTSPTAYVRFHGRNAGTWNKRTGSAAERFDHLYSEEELAEWVEPLRELAGESESVYAMFNNNGRSAMPATGLEGLDPEEVAGDPAKGLVAQAPANALMLRRALQAAGVPSRSPRPPAGRVRRGHAGPGAHMAGAQCPMLVSADFDERLTAVLAAEHPHEGSGRVLEALGHVLAVGEPPLGEPAAEPPQALREAVGVVVDQEALEPGAEDDQEAEVARRELRLGEVVLRDLSADRDRGRRARGGERPSRRGRRRRCRSRRRRRSGTPPSARALTSSRLVVDPDVVAVALGQVARPSRPTPASPTTGLQPAIFASWPTICPTAPAAAETTTVSPGFGLADVEEAEVGGETGRAEHVQGRLRRSERRIELPQRAAARDRVVLPAELPDDGVAGREPRSCAFHDLTDDLARHRLAELGRLRVRARRAHAPAHVGIDGEPLERTSTSPGPGSGTSVSTSAKSDSFGKPSGRAASVIWRFMRRASRKSRLARDRGGEPGAKSSSPPCLRFRQPNISPRASVSASSPCARPGRRPRSGWGQSSGDPVPDA